MHLTVSLNGNGGYHPAAWRLSAAGQVSASAFRDLTTLAERGGFAATLFGLSFDDPAMRTTGRIPLVRPDALPLVASLIAHTETIGLGMTFGLERSEPFNIARSFATLDRLSLGRTAWIIELARPSDGDGCCSGVLLLAYRLLSLSGRRILCEARCDSFANAGKDSLVIGLFDPIGGLAKLDEQLDCAIISPGRFGMR